MPYDCNLLVLRIVTWTCSCLLRSIINHLKTCDCVQTNDYYQIEIITWNNISIRYDYLKPYNFIEIIYY